MKWIYRLICSVLLTTYFAVPNMYSFTYEFDWNEVLYQTQGNSLMADLGLDGHMGYNPKLSLDYYDLDCPYLYYLDTGNDTSSLYLIQKGENPKMEDYLNKIKEM